MPRAQINIAAVLVERFIGRPFENLRRLEILTKIHGRPFQLLMYFYISVDDKN